MNQQMYLDKNTTDSIKGLLIVLIVFGHNHILCPNSVQHGMMEYLYLFHVACFFILPFFYQRKKELSWTLVQTTIVRTWVPYFWACLACWVTYSLMVRGGFKFGIDDVWAFFQGTQTSVKRAFGFVFPWFLPTFCTFSILLYLAQKFRGLQIMLILISLILWSLSWQQFYVLKNVVPFGLVLAIYYYASGFIAFSLNRMSWICKWIGLLVFILLTIVYWSFYRFDFLFNFFPSAFFLSILVIIPYLDCYLLRLLGKNSLGIYLIHMFLVNITYQIFPHTLFWGVLGFVISLFFSLGFVVLLNKNQFLQRFLFPKNLVDLRSKNKV